MSVRIEMEICTHCGGRGTCLADHDPYEGQHSCAHCKAVSEERTGRYPGHYGRVPCAQCQGQGRIRVQVDDGF